MPSGFILCWISKQPLQRLLPLGQRHIFYKLGLCPYQPTGDLSIRIDLRQAGHHKAQAVRHSMAGAARLGADQF